MTFIGYHGTSAASANSIVNVGVNVTFGGGEFGRGFYTQSSASNALRWAIGRHGSANAKLVCITIQNSQLSALNVRILNREKARKLEARIRRKSQQTSYLCRVDVVRGPLNGSAHVYQDKFESSAASTAINHTTSQRKIQP
jgi:hypothetical protein